MIARVPDARYFATVATAPEEHGHIESALETFDLIGRTFQEYTFAKSSTGRKIECDPRDHDVACGESRAARAPIPPICH
ncbi:MAG: hypothetical protein ABW175_05320 [Bradyrhizobium sp.]